MPIVYAVFMLLLVTFGAVVMSLEILSSNLMSPYFGGSIYIWGSIISSFMVHFSVGYVLGGYLSRRLPRLSVLASFLVVCSLWVILIPGLLQTGLRADRRPHRRRPSRIACRDEPDLLRAGLDHGDGLPLHHRNHRRREAAIVADRRDGPLHLHRRLVLRDERDGLLPDQPLPRLPDHHRPRR